MLRTISLLFTGIFFGILLMAFYNKHQESKLTKYIELKEDFILDNGSILKKGSFLRVDKPAPENFDRYILYINYKGSAAIESSLFAKENLVKPYWMYRDTSVVK